MIWLIGNRGMLGHDVEIVLADKGINYVATDIDVDITDFDAIESFAKNKKIDWIINCSAYTEVDKAEEEKEKAFKINSEGVLNIAKVSKLIGAKLIHISTDYVFDGQKKEPYKEDDLPNPLGVYGKSKLEGEDHIKSSLEKYFIIRTAWLYGKNGKNFVYTMLKLFKERDEVKVVSDQYGSPTYTVDLANLIFLIVDNNRSEYGVYHFTNEGRISWFDFAKEVYNISRNMGLVYRDVKIVPITTNQYLTRAKRPMNSYLSKEKIKETFGIEIRKWNEALREFLEDLEGRDQEIGDGRKD